REYDSQVKFVTTELYATLDINLSDLIDQDEVIDAYDELYDDVISGIPAGKDVLIINVWGTDISDTELQLSVAVIYSETGSISELTSIDSWWSTCAEGKCGLQSGYSGLDASDRLNELVNWYRPF